MPELDDAEKARRGDAADESEAADEALIGERDEGGRRSAGELGGALAQAQTERKDRGVVHGMRPAQRETGGDAAVTVETLGHPAVRGRVGLCHPGSTPGGEIVQ